MKTTATPPSLAIPELDADAVSELELLLELVAVAVPEADTAAKEG